MSKRAVVLAGGGSRGAYQMGVWKALREMGQGYDIVTGTSVGALNGAMMVQGDYEKALEAWENLSPETVVGELGEETKGMSDWELHKTFAREVLEKGGADIDRLEGFIDSMVDEEKFRQSPVDFALVTVEYPSLKPLELQKKDIPQGMLREYLLASAACFPAFQTKEIEGRKYMDGGYHDNMPVNLAISMGADEIIAIDLESVGVVRRLKKIPQKLTLIRSLWPLGSFLKFEGDLAKRNIRLGYLDTKKVFGEADGQLYAFEKDSILAYSGMLRRRMEELLSKAQEREARMIAPMEERIMRRMLREFRKRAYHTNTLRPFTLSIQMMMAAEYLGEALDMEPDKEYEFGEFLILLKQKAQSRREELSQEELFSREKFDLAGLSEELQMLDHGFLVLLICSRIRKFLEGKASFGEMLAASAFWKEFAAAVFLYLLENGEQ